MPIGDSYPALMSRYRWFNTLFILLVLGGTLAMVYRKMRLRGDA